MKFAKAIITISILTILALTAKEPPSQETKAPENDQILVGPTTAPKSPEIASYGFEEMTVCSTGTFKSWMDYNKITNKSTTQWRLQQKAQTDEDTGIRTYEGLLMIAMARQYGPAGTRLTINFEDGQTIYAIIGDIKGGTTCQHQDGSMIEFIVDSYKMPTSIRRSGNYNDLFTGKIMSIQKWQKRESVK